MRFNGTMAGVAALSAGLLATISSTAAHAEALSNGCRGMNLAFIDGIYASRLFIGSFSEGERLTFENDSPSAATTLIVDNTATVLGTSPLEYTILAEGEHTLVWRTNDGQDVAWDVSCSGPDNDRDDDGVVDGVDRCPDTVLPDVIAGLKKNRFAANAVGEFVNVTGAPSGYDVADTGGCSALQIIDATSLGDAHRRLGITRGALEDWVNQ